MQTESIRPSLSDEIFHPITIRFADSERDLSLCYSIRQAVFVEEQGIDSAIEFSGSEVGTQSLLAYFGSIAVGSARLALDSWSVKLGRVAVLAPWRGQGIGKELVETAIEFARKRRALSVVLHAQTTVVSFYEKLGFFVEGSEYLEAGRPHRTMRLNLMERESGDHATD